MIASIAEGGALFHELNHLISDNPAVDTLLPSPSRRRIHMVAHAPMAAFANPVPLHLRRPPPTLIAPAPHLVHRARHAPRATLQAPPPPLILGLNVYSHDTSVAILNAQTGALLFALSKERLTRRKHDGGDAATLIHHALTSLSTTLSTPLPALTASVTLVVANNHHFRIAPHEARLPLQVALRYIPPAALSPWNLLGSPVAPSPRLAPNAKKVELSHHIAHAFSAVHDAPFNRGLVVVMDGMGDALHDWQRAQYEHDESHYSEESLPDAVCADAEGFVEFPRDLRTRPGTSFREAETAYVFRRDPRTRRVSFRRIFKRWTPENAPSELENHSFEEMESVGAMYSRVSAILFKDWNACGKVMGLAPYAKQRLLHNRSPGDRFFMTGHLIDGSLSVAEGHLKGLEHLTKSIPDAETSIDLRHHFEDLAFHVQQDLEDVVTSFMSTLQAATGEENLIFAGGVALNSTVNGIISSQKKFKTVFIPPYPGDEGICIGCAAFGYSHLVDEHHKHVPSVRDERTTMPYLGKVYNDEDVRRAVQCFSPWITWRHANVAEEIAQALAESRVVAWFRGRSEFGPRALGNRSILADPRPHSMIDHVNKVVKKREAFRPFAPSVLADQAQEWFVDCAHNSSPFMSVTKLTRKPSVVPAVVHTDETSRLQTVTKENNSEYYDVISRFRDLTGVPMILNTSFNVAGEPIVESPHDAVRTFLETEGIDILAFPGLLVEKLDCSALAETDVISAACASFRSHQVQDSFGSSLRTTLSYVSQSFDEEFETSSSINEHSAELLDGLQLEVLEFVVGKENCSISEICQELLSFSDETSSKEGNSSHLDLPTTSDILDRLVDLYQKRLIFKPCGQA